MYEFAADIAVTLFLKSTLLFTAYFVSLWTTVKLF